MVAGKRRETGKGNSLLDLGARFLFFQLGLLLLWVKLERTMGWNGFGREEGTLGRAKEKHSDFYCCRWLRAATHTIFYILP